MIRPLLEKDVKFVASVKGIDFSDGWDEDMLKSSLKTDNFYGFIIEDEKPFGFITFSLGVDSADLLDVYVLSEYRKKGYAENLIKKMEDFIKENGGRKIFLEVREDNRKAINLYQKNGYKKISERKRYYKDGTTAIIMFKEI